MSTEPELPLKPKRPSGITGQDPPAAPRQLAVKNGAEPSVAGMLQSVIDKGITSENVSALESLVGLYERLQSKEAQRAFNEAFSKLQSAMPKILAIKPVLAKDGSVKYHYAPFEEIMEKVQPFLTDNGFSVSFNTKIAENGRLTSICTLRHVSGHSQTNEFSVRIGQGPPHATEPQADTSAKNMAKRGALSDCLNVVVDHDDDARAIGKPVGRAIAEDLQLRAQKCGADEVQFLKFAGVTCAIPPTIEDYERISDSRFDALDEMLKRKEGRRV
jgi:hypothetical protein